MIKAKKGFLLRKLGNEYMVVAIGEAIKNFNGMIRINETGAFTGRSWNRVRQKKRWLARHWSVFLDWIKRRLVRMYMNLSGVFLSL